MRSSYLAHFKRSSGLCMGCKGHHPAALLPAVVFPALSDVGPDQDFYLLLQLQLLASPFA